MKINFTKNMSIDEALEYLEEHKGEITNIFATVGDITISGGDYEASEEEFLDAFWSGLKIPDEREEEYPDWLNDVEYPDWLNDSIPTGYPKWLNEKIISEFVKSEDGKITDTLENNEDSRVRDDTGPSTEWMNDAGYQNFINHLGEGNSQEVLGTKQEHAAEMIDNAEHANWLNDSIPTGYPKWLNEKIISEFAKSEDALDHNSNTSVISRISVANGIITITEGENEYRIIAHNDVVNAYYNHNSDDIIIYALRSNLLSYATYSMKLLRDTTRVHYAVSFEIVDMPSIDFLIDDMVPEYNGEYFTVAGYGKNNSGNKIIYVGYSINGYAFNTFPLPPDLNIISRKSQIGKYRIRTTIGSMYIRLYMYDRYSTEVISIHKLSGAVTRAQFPGHCSNLVSHPIASYWYCGNSVFIEKQDGTIDGRMVGGARIENVWIHNNGSVKFMMGIVKNESHARELWSRLIDCSEPWTREDPVTDPLLIKPASFDICKDGIKMRGIGTIENLSIGRLEMDEDNATDKTPTMVRLHPVFIPFILREARLYEEKELRFHNGLSITYEDSEGSGYRYIIMPPDESLGISIYDENVSEHDDHTCIQFEGNLNFEAYIADMEIIVSDTIIGDDNLIDMIYTVEGKTYRYTYDCDTELENRQEVNVEEWLYLSENEE